MTQITILRSSDKRFNNKIATVIDGTIKIGRTTYTIAFNSHQPNKDTGDYTPVKYTLEDLAAFRFLKDGVDGHGTYIFNYKIN